MADRSTDEVKRELVSERERLTSSVNRLRSQVERARRKLPFAAAAAAGLGIAAGLVRKRVSGRNAQETGGRARLPFFRD